MKKVLLIIVVLLMIVPIPVQGANKTTSIEAYSQGKEISGDCLAKEVILSDEIKGTMIANDDGLGIIGNEEFVINLDYPVKRFEVIDDLDDDGVKDVAVYLKTSSGYSNFQVISSKSSKVLYELALTHQSTDVDNNVVTKNSIVREIVCSNKIVYLIYDHHLLAIDVNNNKVIFDHEEEDNIWKMVILDEQIIFTTQVGQIVSLDKDKGKENYRNLITSSLEVKIRHLNEKQKVNLNLWNILVLDDKLYVSSEADKIYQINPSDGNVIKELELGVVKEEEISKRLTEQISFDYNIQKETANPTGVFSKAFNGYKMKMIKDNLMLVEAYLGDHDFYPIEALESGIKGIEPTLLVVNTDDLQVKTKIKLEQYNLDSSNAIYTTYQGQEVLVVPSNANQGSLRVSIYSLLNGELIAQNNLKNIGIGLENVKVNLSKNEDNYLLQINDGSSYILQNDLKTINSLGSSQIINKITDLDDGILVSSNQNGKINEIYKLGLNGRDDLLMEVRVPNSYLNNGFEAIHYDRDSNHILSLVNEINDKNVVLASHILIINANDGSLINDKKVLLEKGLDENNKYFESYLIGSEIKYFSDLNNDGKKEILVDNYIIDGNSLTYKSNYEQMVDDNGNVIDVGDLNNDGISDLVSVGETEMRIYYSNKNDYQITYQKSDLVKKYDKGLLNNQQVKVIGDLDHSGIKLFVINARNNNGCQYYQVINPKDLSVKFNLMEEGIFNWGESFILTQIDFNHDGIDDFIFNAPDNIQKILSGKDGSIITEIKKEADNYNRDSSPTALEDVIAINFNNDGNIIYQLEDINSDGIKEIGYIYFNYSDNQNMTKLRILDGKSLEELKVCALDGFSLSDLTMVPVQGQNKVLIKDSDYNQIYDYQNEVLVAGCQIEASKARGLVDGRILIEDNIGQLSAFNDQCDFELVDFKQDKFNTGNITVNYQSDKSGMISVYDQGTLIASSIKKKVNIKLLQGKHRLVFSYDDGHGKITHITKQIEVVKSSIIKYVVILLSLIIVLASILIVIYPRYRLEKKAGVKHAKNN